ncbi:hypothetical protein ACOMHN_062171 [Nucella lapillus]
MSISGWRAPSHEQPHLHELLPGGNGRPTAIDTDKFIIRQTESKFIFKQPPHTVHYPRQRSGSLVKHGGRTGDEEVVLRVEGKALAKPPFSSALPGQQSLASRKERKTYLHSSHSKSIRTVGCHRHLETQARSFRGGDMNQLMVCMALTNDIKRATGLATPETAENGVIFCRE